ncbi:MAG TPA: HEAT repeat domain-containing protein [Kofleriaceae bacterium]|nr:HEAT repeat domain-containing protein [Kofleriaceae bacterium]
MRVLVVLALMVLCARTAVADKIDQNVRALHGSSSAKVRLAAALALSKSRDARAVIAVADALEHDDDAAIRRVCALALEKMVNARTAADATAVALDSLDRVAAGDDDGNVRRTATKAAAALAHFRRAPQKPAAVARGDRPEVFVKIDATIDPTGRASPEAGERLRAIVKKNVEGIGYATAWPGTLPTGADLASAGSQAFIVASTVKKVDISRVGGRTQVACTVSIRIAPWSGSDGGEKWEASRAANAQGSAKATTGTSDRDVANGVRDCLEAVTEDLTARQIVPFLKRLVVATN